MLLSTGIGTGVRQRASLCDMLPGQLSSSQRECQNVLGKKKPDKKTTLTFTDARVCGPECEICGRAALRSGRRDELYAVRAARPPAAYPRTELTPKQQQCTNIPRSASASTHVIEYS